MNIILKKHKNLNKIYKNNFIYPHNKEKMENLYYETIMQQNQPVPISEVHPNEVHPKLEYRIICNNNLHLIRQKTIPTIKQQSIYETVLVEYRCLPHIEFLIRNTILKLPGEWCHTVVCGNLNYDFVVNICNNISPNINVIKTNYDNLIQSEYSLFLGTKDFWNLFKSEKILLYQEDSCLFKSNIEDFIKWDYIGAPWKEIYISPNNVGNGGFSLRTRQTMLDVIDKIPYYFPEDIYFSQVMQRLSLGCVADLNSAMEYAKLIDQFVKIASGDFSFPSSFTLTDECRNLIQ
jgi:hypothetical protein